MRKILTIAMTRLIVASPFLVLLFTSTYGLAGYAATETDVRRVIDKASAAFAEENYQGVLLFFHPQSPKKASTRETLRNIFNAHDLKFEVLDFKFLGEDGPFAFVKVKERTTKRLPDDSFRNNTSDAIYVFRKDAASWKIWDELVLETEFHEVKPE